MWKWSRLLFVAVVLMTLSPQGANAHPTVSESECLAAVDAPRWTDTDDRESR